MAKTKDKQGRLRKRRILKPNVITSQFNDAIEEFNNDSNEVPMSESMVIEPDLAQGMSTSNNPWSVSDASVFLKYCCPECDYSNKNLPSFSKHALKNHVLANTLFNNGNDDSENQIVTIVKSEDQENFKSEVTDDHNDIDTTEIKDEPIAYDDDFDDTFDATVDDNQPEDAPTCVVTGCNFQYNKNQKRFKVYRFPKTPEMVVKWLQKLKIPNFSPSSDKVVCYKHFHDHDIVPSQERNKSGNMRMKKILKPTAVPSLHLSNDDSSPKLSQFLKTKEQKEEIINAKPNIFGWWSCKSCSDQNFLFFFELVTHWQEIHEFNSNLLKYHYENLTFEGQMERDSYLAKDGWSCHICENKEKFDHKFQLVSHWYKHHSNRDVTYEVCQYCSELFTSPECSTVHHDMFHYGMSRREYQCSVCTQAHSYVHSFPYFQVLESHCKQKHDQEFELPYRCSTCDEVFILEEAWLYHQKTQHAQEISSFQCNPCQIDFFSKGFKTIHDATYHDSTQSELFACKYCSEVGESVIDIISHHQTYHEMQQLPFFPCELCDFYSQKLSKTVNHMKKEHNIAGSEYKPYLCKHCKSGWNDIHNFSRHVRTHYQQNVICNICGKELKADSLLYHISSVHKQEEDKEKNFVCDICGYRTDRKQNLTKHNKVHNKKKCPFCDYLAVSKNYIELHIDKRHQEENGGDLNHICSQCGKGFLFKFSLTAHIYLHKNAPGGVLKDRPPRPKHEKFGEYKCDQCDKVFIKRNLLASHKHRKHSPNFKPIERVKCPQCDKTYKAHNYLKEHILKDHEKNTPYACEHCQRSFGLKSTLRTHIVNTHTKVKCDECNQEICNAFLLKRHKAKVHGNKSMTAYQCEFCPSIYEQKGSLDKHVAKNHSI